MLSIPSRLYVATLLSGASALVYEVLWIRALARTFGTTVSAVTTVVATFMAGMTLGALLFGPLADRSRRPFRLYRRVELAIGAWALLLSLLLLRADPLLSWLARLTEATGALAGPVRFLVFAILVLGPSTLIGATLVVLARALASRGYVGRAVGSLYAVNTAGAVLGALLPDFALIPRVGLTATAALATIGNLLAALLAGGFQEHATIGSEAREPDALPRASRAVALFAISGGCAMAAEVLWSRTLEHWAAALVTSFAVLLAVYLAAVALGSWLTRRIADRVADPLAWATLALSLLAPALLIPIVLAPRWRDLQRAWLPRPAGVLRPSMWYEAWNALTHAVYLEGAACLLMGAAFPFLAAASIREGHSGRQTGQLYAANTLAGVVGSVVAGFIALPALGELHAFCAVAITAALGAALLSGPLPRRAHRVVTLAIAVLTLVTIGLLPSNLMHEANFRREGHIIAVREGTTTTAAIAQHFRFGLPSFAELVTPGVSMSDTSFGARRYMGLMAHLGVFFSGRPERALLVCYGVGNTADALLSHPDLGRLDVVDVSSEVLSLSPLFARGRGRDPLRDPRTHVFVDDGRHHLLTRPITYDVITSEPPPPNYAGVVNLYSREYYRAASARLSSGGVLTQWLPVFQLSEGDSKTIIAAFAAELPYTALFYGYRYQWILVGSKRPLVIDAERWQQRASLPGVAASLNDIGVESTQVLYGSMMSTDSELRELVRGVPILTDDAPSIEYPSSAVRTPIRLSSRGRIPARAATLLTRPPGAAELGSLVRASGVTDRVLALLDRQQAKPEELWEARYASQFAMTALPGLGREAVLAVIDADRETGALAERFLAAHPSPSAALAASSPLPASERAALEDALLMLARRRLYLGHADRALQVLALLDVQSSRSARYQWLLGVAELGTGHTSAAASHLRRALELSKSAAFARQVRAVLPRAVEGDGERVPAQASSPLNP